MDAGMPDRNAYDEVWFEGRPFADDAPRVSNESRIVRDVFALYDLLERNAAVAVRTDEVEAERAAILREIAELEALVA